MAFARQYKPKKGKIMKTKLLKGALTRIAATAIAAVFFTPTASAAGGSETTDMTNPVTGETETYENTFIGENAEWTSVANWQLKEESKVPFISGGNYDPALVDGKTVSTSTAIAGWTLRVGAYNNASVTWSGGITKIQASSVGCWLTADETSSITIASFAGNQLEGSDSAPFKLSSAKAGGITWSAGLTSASNTSMPFWYYLKGAGTVVYGGNITVANAQVIKQADVTLSGNATKSVLSKTLVTFGSGTTKTFTADATIKRLDSNGTDLDYDVHLAAVTTGSTTLTTDSAVGTCELVQTSTGIDLYWVDGDPDDIPPPTPTVYKPSININFTSGAANGLTTTADVGLGEYAIPGTSWNNLVANNNGSLSALTSVADSAGTTWTTAASVTISGTRGSYSCSSLLAASDLRHGYIDENGNNPTPTVTVSGIPYDKYRVIVYTATDTGGASFGYITINGKNYTYVNDALTEGTTAWGNAGAQDSAEPIAEGTNVLVSAVMLGSTLTVVGHRDTNARGCIAAIQIVEYVPEVVEGVDLMIPVMGATTYTVSETKELSGTVYVVGSGTLTLDGTAKITAATIDVAKDVVLNVNADRLDGTTFKGTGTVVYDGTAPATGKGWTDSDNWAGTVWIKSQSVSSFEGNQFGNSRSTVRFTGVTGYLQTSSYNNSYVHTVPLELVDEGNTVAFTYNNGWGGNLVKINTLKGTGTLATGNSGGAGEHVYIVDASDFTGAFNLSGKYVYVGGSQPDYSASTNPNGKLEIRSGVTMTVPSGKTWTANGGFVVNGTLVANGTLSSSASPAVSGSGTVVFDGKTPSPTGNAWWKNADWTGTVEVKNHTLPDNWLLSNYGNTGSKVRLDGVSGPIKYGTDSTTHSIKELIIASGGYTHTGKYSSGTVSFTVPCKITGSGTYKMQSEGAAQKTTYFTGDMSEFGGTLAFGDDYSRFVIGSTETPFTAKSIVVGDGAVAKISYPSEWYPAGGVVIDEGGILDVATGDGYIDTSAGIVVNGTVKAKSLRTIWGGICASTPITINSTGVLELISTDNVNDSTVGNNPTSADFSNVTGTGTIKYSSTAGWRAFPDQDAKMPASTVGIQVELADSLIISKSNGETVIGSLSGLKNIRSDFNNNGANGRILTVTQSKDTEWQGKFVSNRITQFNVAAPAEGTPGTLTLSGTQEATIPMQVNGAVNLTGTWVGATTVAGTFGGTGGTLTGSLTLTDGATIKVDDASKYLTVIGGLTASSGTITVDLPAGTKTTFPDGVKLMDVTGTITQGATFKVRIGGVEKSSVVVKMRNGSLKAVSLPGTKIIFR